MLHSVSRLQQSVLMFRDSTGDAIEVHPGADTVEDTEVAIEVAMGTAPIVHVGGEFLDAHNVLNVLSSYHRGRGRGF